jgi:hypothetical protein
MTCKCKGTGRRDGFSEYLDCMEPGCNAATEREEFNKRLKEAGSMSVEDAAWWGYMQAQSSGWRGLDDKEWFKIVSHHDDYLGYIKGDAVIEAVMLAEIKLKELNCQDSTDHPA